MTTIYVTKYALTNGIIALECRAGSSEGTFIRKDHNLEMYHKGDYELTMEAATAKANTMVSKKIDSLRKQINKLETMKF